MSTRLLRRFEAEIGDAPDMLQADCLRAQRAAYQARLGAFERADAEIAALRTRYRGTPHIAVSAWVNLAEGLRRHATDLDPQARDKVQRAHALAQSAGLSGLQALSAAWLAHMAYLRMDAPAIARFSAESLRLANPQDHAARSRASLVVAQSWDEAGCPVFAKPWYEIARRHAVEEGDEATLSALMWNMAVLRLRDLRRPPASNSSKTANAAGAAEFALKERARVCAESIANFDQRFGMRNMRSLHPMLRAQWQTETGACSAALASFASHLDTALKEGMATIAASLLADQAWCQLQMGGRGAALVGARAAEAQLPLSTVPGDRAPAHGRLAQLFAALGLASDAARHSLAAETAWAEYTQLQMRLREALAPLAYADRTA